MFYNSAVTWFKVTQEMHLKVKKSVKSQKEKRKEKRIGLNPVGHATNNKNHVSNIEKEG